MKNSNHLKVMQDVLTLEAQALELARQRLTLEQVNALANLFEYLRGCGGSLIFCGVGKSGLVGQKLASTFCSLGLPSFFLHPVEALHGDLGRVDKNDAIVFLSKSGTTEEIIKLMPFIDLPKTSKLGLLGNTNSAIARECAIVLDCSVEKEACLNNQAPTTSSTLTMAMGDAMAVMFESLTGLTKENFAVNHPGGLLGKSLRIRVRDLMITAASCPIVQGENTLKEVLIEMTKKPVGACAILNAKGQLEGLLVEGDIRRALAHDDNVLSLAVKNVMTKTPISVDGDTLAFKALEIMEKRERPISILPVMQGEEFIGFLRVHDLFKEGFSLN